MNVELPDSIDAAISSTPAKPVGPMPSLLGMACLWGVALLALHAVIWPAPAAQAVPRVEPQGLSAANALELTDEVVTTLAADQFSGMLLKVALAQKVAQRLNVMPAGQ